jgi:hypothetical protein
MVANATVTPNETGAASFTVKVYSPEGYDCMLTLRGDEAGPLMVRSLKALEWLVEHKFTPTRQPLQPLAQPAPPDPTPAEREAELRGMPIPAHQPTAPATVDPGELTFEAEKLAATVNGGKVYWKVSGGRFSKFGVTIWPEVLNAACATGMIACDDELNPMHEYDLTGLTACYVENDGKPQKVTRLIKSRV